MDIRNQPIALDDLENCTVIEGFLLFTHIDFTNSTVIKSYPLLTEVTEYVFIFRIFGLQSLSQIFPNLSIIRGTKLFEGYALLVYHTHLENIGLSKLTAITRGGVRIENNYSLCYVETIDWSRIIVNTTDVDIFYMVSKMTSRTTNCK